MDNDTQLKFLVSYKTWADSVLYNALAEFSQEQLVAERPMLFGSILKLLNHVYAMDSVWKHNLEGIPHKLNSRIPENTPQFTDLKHYQSEINQWYINYVDKLSMEQMNKEISFTFIGGEKSTLKQSNVIQHIVNHSTYHRGHIEGVLYQMSVEPPTTDIPVFIRETKA